MKHALALALGRSAAPGFSPSQLFGPTTKGMWFDPSDLTTMFQNSNGTTPVTADGDPVGYIADKSGRGNHFIQATAGKRPLYKTSGGLSWLDFDGVDDALACAASSLQSGMSCYAAFRPGTAEGQWLIGTQVTGDLWFGVIQASATTAYNGTGTPTARVNKVAIGGNKQDFLTALPAVTIKQVTIEGIDLTNITHLEFSTYAGYEFLGRMYGYIVVPDLSAAQRTKVETYMGLKAGLIL